MRLYLSFSPLKYCTPNAHNFNFPNYLPKHPLTMTLSHLTSPEKPQDSECTLTPQSYLHRLLDLRDFAYFWAYANLDIFVTHCAPVDIVAQPKYIGILAY